MHSESADKGGMMETNESVHSVLELIKTAKNIVVCAGAGISTSCGLPDFRSKDKGLYNNLDAAALGIPSPELLFDLEYFELDPKAFFKFLPTLLTTVPEAAVAAAAGGLGGEEAQTACDIHPSSCHFFVKWLQAPGNSSSSSNGLRDDDTSRLLRVYTLNIDGLEKRAFSTGAAGVAISAEATAAVIVECHGNLTEFTCLRCRAGSSLGELLACRGGGTDGAGTSVPEGGSRYELGSVFYCNKVTGYSDIDSCHTATCGAVGVERRPQRAVSRARATSTGGTIFNRNLCNGVLKPNILFFGEPFNAQYGSSRARSGTDGPPTKQRKKRLTISQMVKADVCGACDCVLIMGMSFKVISCIHDILRLNARRGAHRVPVVYINNQLPSPETLRQLNSFIEKADADITCSKANVTTKGSRTGRGLKRSRLVTTTVISFAPGTTPESAPLVSTSVSITEGNIFDYILLGDADFITGYIQNQLSVKREKK